MSPAFRSPFREFFTLIIAIQGVHVFEHIMQLIQVYILHEPEDHALGVLGYLLAFHGTEEYLHFVFNVTYAASLYVVLVNIRPMVPDHIPARAFLLFCVFGVGLESWHVVEHMVIMRHVLQNNGCPCPGIADAATGLSDTVIHFFYNGIAYIATWIPFWYLMHRREPTRAALA